MCIHLLLIMLWQCELNFGTPEKDCSPVRRPPRKRRASSSRTPSQRKVQQHSDSEDSDATLPPEIPLVRKNLNIPLPLFN